MVVEWACLAREHERGRARPCTQGFEWSEVPITHSLTHMTPQEPPCPETVQYCYAIQGHPRGGGVGSRLGGGLHARNREFGFVSSA